MSGTPMPQSERDLIPQFSFLYPEIAASADNVANLIKPIYVRTTKGELRLPPVTRHLIELNMNPVQDRLYNLMKFQVAREAEQTLTRANKQAFRALGRSIMRLLALVSNPALLATDIGLIRREMLSEVLAEGDSPKIQYACKRARILAKGGKKVLIWSAFRKNVEIIADRLSELGAVYIHGAVDAGDEEDVDSREGKIRIFHDDPKCFVMVANPAAASEGISLHKVCHHAIYVDRTYNAAHYLQSEDRIHRLGLRDDQSTTLEILECRGTIDESIRHRLSLKTSKMAEALEDKSLQIDPIPFDLFDVEDAVEAEVGSLDMDDVKDLLDLLRGAS
jgi:SNF2 family DNA or RNA helicase